MVGVAPALTALPTFPTVFAPGCTNPVRMHFRVHPLTLEPNTLNMHATSRQILPTAISSSFEWPSSVFDGRSWRLRSGSGYRANSTRRPNRRSPAVLKCSSPLPSGERSPTAPINCSRRRREAVPACWRAWSSHKFDRAMPPPSRRLSPRSATRPQYHS